MNLLERLVLCLPESWLKRIDDWVNKPEPPRCPYVSPFDRQCQLRAGHRGTCMTHKPYPPYYSYWYGINFKPRPEEEPK